ncbi:hypothetical protein Sfulv_61520 [Streptomyces fulvorobeus]|uniref:Uncharacterized protein n=1 Tax=Streptomyces fulvorobeus TaxID=284028 RepID=A0A7J0CFT2_9ACTN|nr:hypothetical protein Sfulv_61520 [Streptomyces fulvorobeus]
MAGPNPPICSSSYALSVTSPTPIPAPHQTSVAVGFEPAYTSIPPPAHATRAYFPTVTSGLI